MSQSNEHKVLILSSYESSGGAARAANRLHKSLVDHGADSRMWVRTRNSDDWRVQGPAGPIGRIKADIRSVFEALPVKLQKTKNPILHSPGWINNFKARQINSSDADVVNLHWVCDGLISVAQIGKITKPVVWTMHDSWTFCGMEHHPKDSRDLRFVEGYTTGNRPDHSSGLDLDRWTWNRKLKSFRSPMHLVSPSNWLAEIAGRSKIAGNWPIRVIPNPLDTNIFKPIEKSVARDILHLPLGKKIILVGAFGSVMNPNKGFDLLTEALGVFANKIRDKSVLSDPAIQENRADDYLVVVFGQSEPREFGGFPLPIRFLGHFSDDHALSLVYNAADVVVVPSRMENLPQTATEAQACGVPVVAFDVCGIPDAVVDKETGYLARAYDTLDMGSGIGWIFESTERYRNLSQAARARALKLWSPDVVAAQYDDWYRHAMDTYRK